MLDALVFAGKFVLGGYFIFNALGHLIFKRQAMVGYAAYKGVPYAGWLILFTGLLLGTTGLAVWGLIPGVVGAVAAIVFFVPVSYKMHDFWTISAAPNATTAQVMQIEQSKGIEQAQFMKNVAILAGLLIVLLA